MAFSHRHVLRATIEFTTPFLVAAGKDNDLADAVFVADANGLPAIPGSSLAGVLRSAMRANDGNEDRVKRIFGYQNGSDGQGSRLTVSWGCIHDHRNRPVEGINPPASNDAVLACAQNPLVRDHVRINHRGVSDAATHGKFDEMALCAGHRFTFELEMVSDGSPEAFDDWRCLLDVLRMPFLRLGGKTRRGFGSFRFVRLLEKTFDLRKEFDLYVKHPVHLSRKSDLQPLNIEKTASNQAQTVRITLNPRSFWMFGGGTDKESQQGDADMAPFRDSRIVWIADSNGERGEVKSELLVIPATGIKGALSHRVAFHYNALLGKCIDMTKPLSEDDLLEWTGERNFAVQQLFGFCKGKDSAGQRGRVILDDLYLENEPPQQLVHHVGLDRFTGGARDQVLFSERPFWRGNSFTFDMHILEMNSLQPEVKEALRRALDDLVNARLQVGAGHGRGNGFFEGKFEGLS